MLPPSHHWGQMKWKFCLREVLYIALPPVLRTVVNCIFLDISRKKSRQQIAWDPIKRKSSGAGGVINPTNRSSGQNWKLFLHNVRSGEKEEISKLPAHVGASNSKLDQTLDLSISTSNTLSSLSCLLWRRCEKNNASSVFRNCTNETLSKMSRMSPNRVLCVWKRKILPSGAIPHLNYCKYIKLETNLRCRILAHCVVAYIGL